MISQYTENMTLTLKTKKTCQSNLKTSVWPWNLIYVYIYIYKASVWYISSNNNFQCLNTEKCGPKKCVWYKCFYL